jgi:hypothetical protein
MFDSIQSILPVTQFLPLFSLGEVEIFMANAGIDDSIISFVSVPNLHSDAVFHTHGAGLA